MVARIDTCLPRRWRITRCVLHGIVGASVTALTLWSVPAATVAQGAGELGKTVWGGVYNADQAGRGKDAYLANCAACHRPDLMGADNAPALATLDYIRSWDGRSVYDLFTLISTFMPLDKPGSLDKNVYLDITTFVLQANHFPAGSQELPSDDASLRQIAMVPKPK